ncbi:MAG: T9SS type A sorting domain-containing protein [Crocinitomicaceae bacterium]|nr:T9SS type A sorting domain-containing protein [Crocinitomicaceae bacterium]
MRITLLVLITTLISSCSFGQNQWVMKDSVNGAPRSVSSSFVINGEGYIIGGLDASGFRRKMYSYTFWQDDWDDEPSIGGVNGAGLNRGSACAFSVNNKGYLCLGQGETNPFFSDLWEFDEDTDAWTQKANFIGSARRQAVAFVIGETAYVGTGIDANGLQNDMYKYEPLTNTWTQLNPFGGTARKEATGFSMGGQGYIGTGDDGVMRNDFWQYEPTTDSWLQKTDFPGTARKGAVGWGIFPTAFICTGEDINFSYTKDLYEYNYFSDTWVQRADFLGPGRSNAVVFIQNDLAFVGTGYDGILYDDMYAYRRILGVDELSSEVDVRIFPNPVKTTFSVQSNLKNVDLEVCTVHGKNVTSAVSIQKTTNGFKGNRLKLPPGQYYIRLINKSNSTVHAEKIILI